MFSRHVPAFSLALIAVFALAACGADREDSYNTDKQRNSRYEYGSSVSEKGGFVLFGDRDDKRKQEMAGASGIGVNGFLWRASLDTVSFMPIASADPFGGTIITDWYAPPSAPNERIKLTIFVLSRELRADGIKVSVFRQVKDNTNNWADAQTTPATAGSVEDSILTRARQLRIKQLDAAKKS